MLCLEIIFFKDYLEKHASYVLYIVIFLGGKFC